RLRVHHLTRTVVELGPSDRDDLAVRWGGNIGKVAHADEGASDSARPIDVPLEPFDVGVGEFATVLDVAYREHAHLLGAGHKEAADGCDFRGYDFHRFLWHSDFEFARDAI